jgi:hypothetical protein
LAPPLRVALVGPDEGGIEYELLVFLILDESSKHAPHTTTFVPACERLCTLFHLPSFAVPLVPLRSESQHPENAD